jgi:hypothetical protein
VGAQEAVNNEMPATLPAKGCSSSSGAFGWKLVSQRDSVCKAKVGVTRFAALQVIDGPKSSFLGLNHFRLMQAMREDWPPKSR